MKTEKVLIPQQEINRRLVYMITFIVRIVQQD